MSDDLIPPCCFLRCPLLTSPLSYLSYMHLSTLGSASLFFFFSGMSTSSFLLTMCSSLVLITWPYHLSGFSVIFLDACVILVVPIQSVSLGSTTDIVSPGHIILWLPPHLIPAQPCPFIYVVQPLFCWSSIVIFSHHFTVQDCVYQRSFRSHHNA